MKKKLFLLMTVLCCFVLAVGILAACNGDAPDDLGEPGDEDVITYGRYYAVTPSSSYPVWLQLNPDFTWEMSVGISTSGTYEITSPYEMIFYSGDMQVCIARYDAGAGAVTLEIEGNTLTFYMDQFGGEDGEPKFTVTFRVDGNIYDSQTQLDAGDLVAPPEVEPQSGKYLDGWYTDPNFTEKWDFDNNMVASSLDLYARWLTGEIEAVYSPGWMRESAELDVEKLALQLFVEFDHPDLPSVIDFGSICQIEEGVEMRLFKDAACSEEISLELPLSEAAFADGDNLFYLQTYFPDGTAARVYTVNLFKQYPVIVYAHDPYGDVFFSIQFDAPYFGPLYSDGQRLETIEQWAEFYRQQGYAHGAFDGYTLTGWYVDDEEYNSTGMVKQDAHVYPICTPNEYTVTLDAEEGSVSTNTVTVTYDADFTFPVAVREYYQFDGWFLADGTRITDANGQSTSGWTLPNDTTVYAKYTIDRYNVLLTADTDGAKVIGTGEYDVLSEVTVQAVSPLGYDFVGWYEGDTLCTTDLEYTFTVPVDGVELTAKWTVKDEMAGYIFTATDSGCHITGVTDTTVTELYIPEYVTDIANTAFSDCEMLERITVSEDNPGYYSQSGVLYSNNQIEYVPLKVSGHVVIPEGVSTIRDQFVDRKGITALTVPSTVQVMAVSWNMGPFVGCDSLRELYITDLAAWCNIYMSSYTDSPLAIVEKVYIDGQLVQGSITIPDGVTQIKEGVFYGFKGLRSVILPESLTYIGFFAFANTGLTSVTIPESVTVIAGGTFYGCTDLTSITIHNNVTDIEDSAFEGCSNITSATMPTTAIDYIPQDSLQTVVLTSGESIGNRAFYGCSSLTSIAIPDSVTSIGAEAFYGCSSLTSVTIPDGVTSIENYVFYNCSSLTSVTIPDSVTNIGYCAFWECSSLTSITIPNSVTSIGGSAFYGCSGLALIKVDADNAVYASVDGILYNKAKTEFILIPVAIAGDVAIPGSVTSIGNSAFRDRSSLTSVTIGEGVTSIGDYAFYGCSGLTSVTIGDGVMSIGSVAFDGCSSLTSLIIPDSVTSIGNYAFEDCSSLTSVTIGNGVMSIGYSPFSGCNSLERMTIPFVGATKDGTSNKHFGYIFGASSYSSNEDYVPASLKEVIITGGTSIVDYAFLDCSSLTSVTIPDSVTSIERGAFSGCSSLESITLPFVGATKDGTENTHFGYIFGASSSSYNDDYVPTSLKEVIFTGGTSIGDRAFWYCRSLTSVTIGDGVTIIGGSAFYGCRSLTSVTIPDRVTSIGDSAFYACSSLTSVTIPNSVTIIGEGAFWSCSRLISITIPNSVTSIGNRAFYGCSSLTSITIPDSVTSIGNSAFSGCSGLTSAIIPDSVTSIGNSAFSGCSSLTSVTIPDSVTSIGNSAFYGCSGLTSVTIGDGVMSIGSVAFDGCSNLTSVIIPDSVTSIGESAFSGCSSLTSITIPDSVTSIGESAFSGCSGLKSVTIGEGVTSIGQYAFQNCSSLESITLPFVGAAKDETYYTCFGYIFGASSYSSNEDYVPASLKEVIITGGTSIGSNAFYGCSDLTSVTIGNGVTSIGGSAFSGCSGLTSVTIGNGVTSIGFSAFERCSGLTAVYITDIAAWCGIEFDTSYSNPLYYAHNLYLNGELVTDLVIPNSVTSISSNAFYGCSNLTSIIIPNSVTSIGFGAFENCSSLESITLPFVGATKDGTSNTHFGYIFGASSGYNNSYVPTSLKEIIITGGTSIGDYAFYNCTGLTSITIPDSVTSIGNRAFYNCSGLTLIIIPDSVTSIGSYAFDGCSKLIEVYNKSGLDIVASSTGHGYVAYYAKNVYTQEGGSWFTDTSDGFRFFYDGEQGYLMGYYGSETEIDLPASFTAYDETLVESYAIYKYAFAYCSDLISITIPHCVTSIGYEAFYKCSGLSTLVVDERNPSYNSAGNCIIETASKTLVVGCKNSVIPDDGSITIIGDYAFYNCDGLTSITIPDGVTNIGQDAFRYCSSLTSVTIPDSVTSIGNHAFSGCSSLTSVIIPDSVTSIGSYAFNGCSSMTSITIPDGVTSIGSYTFDGCRSLTSVTIPDSVTSIGESAFWYCSSLTSITIGNGVKSIGNGAFAECSSLTSIAIPDSVTSIGPAAFRGCTNLIEKENGVSYVDGWAMDFDKSVSSVELREGTRGIAEFTFSTCTGLTSITIPDSVTSIGLGAFSGCSSLESITLPFVGATKDGAENTHFGYIFGASSFSSNDDYVPASLKKVIITGGTSIGSNAFYGCSGLISVTIGDGVTNIGSYAFDGCSSLTSVTIGDSVTSIGSYAFSGCIGLTLITIPDSVTSIGVNAFRNCTNLIEKENGVSYVDGWVVDFDGSVSSIELREGTRGIADRAFDDCTGLTSITIPDSVTSIGWYAFYGCSGLTSITIPDSVTSIGDNAFYGCTKLTSVNIGNGVTSIGSYVFAYCSGLTSITIPDSVTSIGDSAFRGCSGLTSITIPDSVTSIGDSAFRGCSGLTSVIIPDSVTSIGDNAFYGCTKLTSVNIGNDVTSIGTWAFSGCSNLTSVIFEETAGWYYASSSTATSGTEISSSDLADPATAAEWLTSTYQNYYWKRNV